MANILPDSDSEDELPPGWEERATVDGRVYYANHTVKATQWTHPRTGKKKKVSGELPFGWEKKITEEGKIFYVDHIHQKTTYTDPRLAFAVEEKDSPTDIRQRFDASSTALQVLHGRDLGSKVAIITGANSGIGFETAKSLAFHGATVVFACRDVAKAEEAVGLIRRQRPNAKCEVMELDLASLRNVKAFATSFKLRFKQLHILILNAGVFGIPFSQTEDGYETIFQANHLAHFYLALLLEPVLAKSVPSRVVVVASESHRFSYLSKENCSLEYLSPSVPGQFTSMISYNNSKLCNILFARELNRRWEEKGITCNSLHPGNMVSSNLSRHWWFYRLLFAIVRPFTKSLQQASATLIYCATAHDLEGCGGLYFNNCCRCPASPSAEDDDLAAAVWDLSINSVEKALGKGAWAWSGFDQGNANDIFERRE